MPTVHRIANLLPNSPSMQRVSSVPDWAVGVGFVSEVVNPRMPIAVFNAFDRSVTEIAYADAGMRAEQDGCAAVVINTVGDYGFRSLRAALRIPVVGCGQAAMQVASGLGRRFAIVTIYPPTLSSMYDQLVEGHGYRDRCLGVRHVTADEELRTMHDDDGFMSAMLEQAPTMLDRIECVARRAIADGADAIVLGCTCMGKARDALQERLDRPVVDPLVVAHKTAELLVSLSLSHASAEAAPLLGSALETMVEAVTSSRATASQQPDGSEAACGDTCDLLSEELGDQAIRGVTGVSTIERAEGSTTRST